MQITKTTKTKITKGAEHFRATLEIYQSAFAFVSGVVVANRRAVFASDRLVERQRAVEQLVVRTGKRSVAAENDFGARFHKFPSYLRRSVINDAIGAVESHDSRLDNWRRLKESVEAKGKRFVARSPAFSREARVTPVLYKGNMFLGELAAAVTADSKSCACRVKVYKNRDWVWQDIEFSTKSLKKRGIVGFTPCSPRLVRTFGGYELHTAWEGAVTLPKLKHLDDVVVCGVDLNLVTDAVCVAMGSGGTVLARAFLRAPCEKDRLNDALDRIALAQRVSGFGPKPNLWRRANSLSDEIANRIASGIVAFAVKHGCHVIAMENLKGLRPRGKGRKQRVHHWRKIAIARKVEEQAHYFGLRFSRINPTGTSKYAFDGSGPVVRSQGGKIATFTTGKVYNADLNAALNIAARWFVREFFNRLPEKKKDEVRAKAPAIQAGPASTLATLVLGWRNGQPVMGRNAMPCPNGCEGSLVKRSHR